MLFQSQVYILGFLPVAALLYYAVASSPAARQWVLLAVSLVFYGWWDVRFVPLLIGQVLATWLLAALHGRMRHAAPLVVGIGLNLAWLGTFKYLDFLLSSLEAASHIDFPRANPILGKVPMAATRI